MKVTLEYVVLNIGFQTAIALGLAVLMHRLTKSGIIRGSILLPFLIANVVVALLWFWMLDYQIGIVNNDHLGARPRQDRLLRQRGTGPSRRSPSSTSGGTWATRPC